VWVRSCGARLPNSPVPVLIVSRFHQTVVLLISFIKLKECVCVCLKKIHPALCLPLGGCLVAGPPVSVQIASEAHVTKSLCVCTCISCACGSCSTCVGGLESSSLCVCVCVFKRWGEGGFSHRLLSHLSVIIDVAATVKTGTRRSQIIQKTISDPLVRRVDESTAGIICSQVKVCLCCRLQKLKSK